jgi:hypothetical protein
MQFNVHTPERHSAETFEDYKARRKHSHYLATRVRQSGPDYEKRAKKNAIKGGKRRFRHGN